jgi:two-component system, NtrC family, nitrogen regulation response regulator GlnG
MQDHPLDYPTLIPGAETTAVADNRLLRQPALTIVWHRDVGRIGESALLPPTPCALSRLEPLFGDRLPDAARTPLADPYISSREPSLMLRAVADGIDIAAGASAHVKVNGVRLRGTVIVPRSRLDAGIIITVARSVVLCLHLARPVRAVARTTHGLVGVSDAIDDIRREIDQVADLDVPVLIRGESGTGKGMIAKALVASSSRADRPFLSLNMGAIVPSTAASELFGHERGSFTGATVSKAGLFAAAHGGSLFLDEIGTIPAEVKPTLLHVLDSGEIRPVGSTRSRTVDVRVIAATDANLEAAIRAGTFTEALLQRFARYRLTVPPLRDRREDFGLLLVHFFRGAFKEYGEPDRLLSTAKPWLTASTVAALARREWPGNIRELENVAGEIVVASRGQATATLPGSVRAMLDDQDAALATAPPQPFIDAKAGASRISEEQLADALARSNGSASQAAKILGVSRTTYYELRRRHPAFRSVTAIPEEEILACHDECNGDVSRMADRLRVPVKALKDRLAHRRRG